MFCRLRNYLIIAKFLRKLLQIIIYVSVIETIIIWSFSVNSLINHYGMLLYNTNKGNNKITELRTILQRESQNS